ncbi:hypothetical protein IWQ56_000318 [Coemansia nantahalensis]|nr:hypothetical protein IWQ56_000318 [Coemansia nantahalensis]
MANSSLLSTIWFAARIVPFSDGFLHRITATIRNFVWGGKVARLAYQKLQKPKREGGLGLLDLKRQATVIYGAWLAEAFNPLSRRWWAEAARGYIANSSRQAGLSPLKWLVGFTKVPKMRGNRDPGLRYAIQAWKDLQGRADGAEALEMLDLPLRSRKITDKCGWRWQTRCAIVDLVPPTLAGLRALARHAEEGDERCAEVLQMFREDVEAGLVKLLPASTRILDAPEDELTQQHFRNFLKVADILPVRYRPRLVRTLLHRPAPVPVDTERWRADWVLAAEPTDWMALHKTPLEPKQISLLWKQRHGCVPTAKETQYGIPDGTPSCPICFSLADGGDDMLPEPNHREDLAHYFFDCTRVRRFWLLVGQFMRSAIPRAALSGPLTITPSEVVHGFGKWSRVLPNHRVWHGLANRSAGPWHLVLSTISLKHA